MILPRKYQLDIENAIRAAFRVGHRCVLMVLSTGGGKTYIFCKMTHGAIAKGNRVVIGVHRKELHDQVSKMLREFQVPHGSIMAGFPINQFHPVQIASIQTLVKRLDKIQPPDLFVVDEAHHCASGSYQTILNAWPLARVVGVTATPERLDGKGLGSIFSHMVRGPEMSWLISQGFLARPKYLSIPIGWTDEGKQLRAGDFKPEDMAFLDTPKIVGDVVAHYQKHADGMTAIAFCVNVKHAEDLAEAFRVGGIAAASIDGTMAKETRRGVLSGLAAGAVRVLTSCELVSEGFDLPAVGAAILARPTASLGLYLQQVGRALRPHPDKPRAIICDHVGNVRRHGLAEEFREWSLEGSSERKKKQKQEPKLACRQCPSCYAVHAPAFVCPECGYDYRKNMESPETADGELVEIGERDAEFQRCVKCGKIHAIACERCPSCGFCQATVVKRQARQAQGMATDMAGLIALGTQRGYRNPRFWAENVIAGRNAKVAV